MDLLEVRVLHVRGLRWMERGDGSSGTEEF